MTGAPFFSNEHTTLYQGDCLAVLPQLPENSVDGIIADPPYCSGAFTLNGKQQDSTSKYTVTGVKRRYPVMLGDNKDQRSFLAWTVWWLTDCYRVAKDGAPLLVFIDWRQLPIMTDAVQLAGFCWRGILTWHKVSARPSKGDFKRDAEFLVYASKGKLSKYSSKCFPGVFRHCVNPSEKQHITGKPIALLKELTEFLAPDGGIILDPFIGSGTTALAARKTGRRCIGVEMSGEYASIAAKRLN